jgi:hypothetical protein
MRRAGHAALLLAVAACSRRAPLTSCDDDLRGVYRNGDERWMILDKNATVEAYPLFPDADGPADLVTAPRKIELTRSSAGAPSSTAGPASHATDAAAAGRSTDATTASRAPGAGTIAGTLHRRYMRGAARCDARIAIHVTRCAGDTLDLVLADPSPPIGFAPCAWPGPAPSRLVHWQRE